MKKELITPVFKITSAADRFEQGRELKLSEENFEGLFQNSIRVLHVCDIERIIERQVRNGYTYTITAIPSLTRAEKELFETAGYEVINQKPNARDGNQEWHINWEPSKKES